jgi:hypothetical protein
MGKVAWVCILLLFSIVPNSSLAQTEPQPEVDVTCSDYYGNQLSVDPDENYYYYGSVTIECTLKNNEAYSVEVEIAVEWVYSHNYDDSGNLNINANSEVYIDLQLTGDDDSPAGFETFTLYATVVEYGEVRECTGCETTSSSTDVEVLPWISMDVDLISESPEGTFNLNDIYEFQECSIENDYYLNAQVEVEGNYEATPTIGFDYDYYGSYPTPGTMKVQTPKEIVLDIGVGESTEFEATFSIEISENPRQDIYIIFILVLGENDDVEEYLKGNDGYYSLDYYIGGCMVLGELFDEEFDFEPIIIETKTDNSKIYLLAGVGGATTVCLLIALITILVRKRD